MTHHIPIAKLTFVAASTAVGSAAAAIAAPTFNWNVVVAAIVGAGVSSTISGLVTIGLAIFLNRKLAVIHDTVNHLADDKAALAREAGRAEGELKGVMAEQSRAAEAVKK